MPARRGACSAKEWPAVGTGRLRLFAQGEAKGFEFFLANRLADLGREFKQLLVAVGGFHREVEPETAQPQARSELGCDQVGLLVALLGGGGGGCNRRGSRLGLLKCYGRRRRLE